MKKIPFLLVVMGVFGSGCIVNSAPPSSAACVLASNSGPNTPHIPVGIGYSGYGGSSVAQPFIPSASGDVSTVSISLQSIGTFSPGSQTITVTIESNTLTGLQVGAPNGVPISESTGLDASSISSGAPSMYTFTMNSAPLADNQVYWIRVHGSYPVSNTTYVAWDAVDGASGAYSVEGVTLGAIYETSVSSNFSTAQIGTNRFTIFNVGC
jgi:hypothetical protein